MSRRAWVPARALVLGLALALGGGAWAQQPPAALAWPSWGVTAEERPAEVMAELQALDLQAAPETWRRAWWRAQGVVAAVGQDDARLAEAVAALRHWAGTQSRLALADAQLIEALQAEREGRILDLAPGVAEAEAAYATACRGAGEPGCDLAAWWRLLRLRGLWAECKGLWIEARAAHRQAVVVAQRAHEPLLQAWSWSALAVSEQVLGDGVAAQEHLTQARRLLAPREQPGVTVRVLLNQARLEERRGETAAALRVLDEALGVLADGQRPRLQAVVQTNRADLLGRVGRLREAVLAAEAAWPVVQRFGDRRIEPVLQFNLGLAHLAQGQLRQGRSELALAVAAFERAGALGALREALRQGGDALQAAGDAEQALRWFHRERELGAEQDEANRAAALHELRRDHDRAAELQEVERLRHENLLAQARLDSQSWQRRLQWLIGGSLLAIAAMLGVLVLRTRAGTQRLRGRSHRLRWLGGRDPLTGLANRRRLMDRVEGRASGPQGFTGGVLMIDVDHFKRINDVHGHAAGDAVLAAVARRLRQALAEPVALCRWGGEEFLAVLPDAALARLPDLLARVMGQVADEPVLAAGVALEVRLSVGAVAFPLAGEAAPVSWDTALVRADLALYTAKALGRDQAVILREVQADSEARRRVLATDFAEARGQGLVAWTAVPRQSGVAVNESRKLA